MMSTSGFSMDSYVGSENFFNYSESIQNPSNVPTNQFSQNTSDFNEETNLKASDYLVAFSISPQSYCVGLVDMVSSTKISAELGTAKSSRYYQIFLNSMSKILSKFGGFVIKNVGDCLFYYFPESVKSKRKFGFLSCLEASLAMIESHDYINTQLTKEGLPRLDYRVSADYGPVSIMKTNTSDSIDMIGPPVNMCSKINRCSPINGVSLGGDLYQMVRQFHEYSFKQVESYSIGLKHSYPVYTIVRKGLN